MRTAPFVWLLLAVGCSPPGRLGYNTDGGGAVVASDLAMSFASIQGDIDSRCALPTCHGGTQSPVFMVNPANRMTNCTTFKARVTLPPENSTMMQKTRGDLSHGGGPIFGPTTEQYIRWVAWINAGQVCN